MSITRNDRIVTLKDSFAEIDIDSLSMLGKENVSTLDVLSSRISGSLSGTSDDNWSDEIKTQLNQSTEKIDKIVKEAIKSTEFIEGAVGPLNNLKTVCNEYIEKFDDYDALINKDVEQYLKDEKGAYVLDANKNKIESEDYINWQQEIKAYEESIPLLEEEVLTIENSVKNYFAAVDFNTNVIDSNIYAQGSSDITFNFSDYFNGKLKTTKEEYVETHESVEIDEETGNIVLKEEYKVNKEFEDGSTLKGDRTVDQVYEDTDENEKLDKEKDILIEENIHEEGELTTPDGDVYDYEHNEKNDQLGLVHQDTTLKDQETEETVYEQEEDRTSAYETSSEIKVNETNRTTKEKGTTTEEHVIVESNGKDTVETVTTVTTIDDDPDCGVVPDPETGETTTVYRDEDGNLRYKTEYVDGNGNTQLLGDYDIPEEIKTLTITYPDGSTKEMEVNPNNPIDQQKIYQEMQEARGNEGCNPSEPFGQFLEGLLVDGSSTAGTFEYEFTLE